MPPNGPLNYDPNAPVTVEPFADPNAWALIKPWYDRAVAGDSAWTQAGVVFRPENASEFFNTEFNVQGFLTPFEQAGTIGLSGRLRTGILTSGAPRPTYIDIRRTAAGLVSLIVQAQGWPMWVYESPNVYHRIDIDLEVCVIDGFNESNQTEVHLLASLGERHRVAGP